MIRETLVDDMKIIEEAGFGGEELFIAP